MSVTCNSCGTVVEGDDVPLGWVVSVEDHLVRRYCDRCARENLRAIEARLDPAWW
jgi:hypothetical protein